MTIDKQSSASEMYLYTLGFEMTLQGHFSYHLLTYAPPAAVSPYPRVISVESSAVSVLCSRDMFSHTLKLLVAIENLPLCFSLGAPFHPPVTDRLCPK